MGIWDCIFGKPGETSFSEKDWNDAKEHLKGKEQEREKELDPLEGVGEPIISFVKLLEGQPERFLWKKINKCYVSRHKTRWDFLLHDLEAKKRYAYSITKVEGYTPTLFCERLSVDGISFITEEEESYLLAAHKRVVKHREWNKKEKERLAQEAQRQEYVNLYCKE